MNTLISYGPAGLVLTTALCIVGWRTYRQQMKEIASWDDRLAALAQERARSTSRVKPIGRGWVMGFVNRETKVAR
jgi:hypothetical protein